MNKKIIFFFFAVLMVLVSSFVIANAQGAEPAAADDEIVKISDIVNFDNSANTK